MGSKLPTPSRSTELPTPQNRYCIRCSTLHSPPGNLALQKFTQNLLKSNALSSDRDYSNTWDFFVKYLGED